MKAEAAHRPSADADGHPIKQVIDPSTGSALGVEV